MSDDERLSSSSGGVEVEGDDTRLATEKPSATSAPPPRRTIFVRSLAKSVTTESLTEFFSQSYPIRHATVVVDPSTKESRGFGFVTLVDHEDVPRVMEELQGAKLDGRKIKLDIAEPRNREVDETVDGKGKSHNIPSATTLKIKEGKEKQKLNQQPPKLIIRNLPWGVKSDQDLAGLFRSYGKVKKATIPKRPGGKHPGFGFVVLRGRKNAESAIEGVNGKEVDGRTLAVDWAVEKQVWEQLQHDGNDKPGEEKESKMDVDIGDSEPEEDEEMDDTQKDSDSDDDISETASDDKEAAGSDQEDEDEAEDKENEEDSEDERNNSTVFIRNLPWTATNETLYEHFKSFGPLRYARIVLDHESERPRGTAFVCFWKPEDCLACLKNSPKKVEVPDRKHAVKKSVLEDTRKDPSGRYTMDGRVLHLSQAVSKSKAHKLEEEGFSKRTARDGDKRRLFLLSEGAITSSNPVYAKLSPAEIKAREESAKQRQRLIKTNPILHLSLTRLSVRNLPRNIDSKALKSIAREAVVGFAKDVKAGLRKPLTNEEITRGKETLSELEKLQKLKGKGIVRQAKVVFETPEGSKAADGSKETAGQKSRGYGFIEYTSHRSALMGLRWLNGRDVSAKSKETGESAEKRRRLIVEFAIENAQVVKRRMEREQQARSGRLRKPNKDNADEEPPKKGKDGEKQKPGKKNTKKPQKKGEPKQEKNSKSKENKQKPKPKQAPKTKTKQQQQPKKRKASAMS